MRPLTVRTLRLSACTLACSLVPSLAWAGSWQANINYGGNMSADLYTPDNPSDPAPLIIALHFCGGTKGNAQGWFKSYADQMGFYIITPQAGGNCFDATAARSGERAEIVKMVDWAVAQHGVDSRRVYASGDSSGACMTQALLAAYPEVFAAGSSLAGVPAGAWTGGNDYAWSAPNQSAQQWGDKVRSINPDYTGPWPRMQIWHGEGDTNLTYAQTFPAEVAQWTNVWGFTDADAMNEMVKPPGAQNTWNRDSYVDERGVLGVETNHAPGVQHDLSGAGLWGDVVRFLAPDMVPDTGGDGSGGGDGAGGSDGSNGAGGSTGTGGLSGAGGASGPGAGGGDSSGSDSGGATSGGIGSGGAAQGGPASGGTTGTGAGFPGSGGMAIATGGGSTDTDFRDDGGGCSVSGLAPASTRSVWGFAVVAAFGLMLGRRRRQS